MTTSDSRVDRIVDELMERSLSKEERIALLRELVEHGDDVPDEILEVALRRLMQRLTD